MYKLVEDEIKTQINNSKVTKFLNQQQYTQELNDARKRFRYKYERIVLKSLHFSQQWFKQNLDRDSSNELLTRAGLDNGKFLVRSSSSINNPLRDAYKISLCFANDVKHYKIKTNIYSSTNSNGDTEELSKYCLEGGLEFDSITQLVDYYHRCSDGLAFVLRTPLIQAPRINSDLLTFLSSRNTLANNSNTNSRQIQHQQQQQHHKGISALLSNGDNIYNSNRMYDFILNKQLNTNNDDNNNNQLVNNRTSNRNRKGDENAGSGESGVAYLDDEPANPNDISNLNLIPEMKRSLFEKEENYTYGSLSAESIKEIDIKDLVIYDKLGSGCFGCVYRGALLSRAQETPVAIKQLNLDNDESKDEISKEAELMKSLNNPFVVKFIGMCYHQNGSLMIVLELAKLGPLHKYLRAHKSMSIIQIVKICYQVALAMQYLSSKNLVHRDLAARNVLLVSEDLAKVSDFGMSRKMGENKYYETHSQGKWPLKWYPPDATTSGKFDEKSDVWSYGVTCWEATSYGGRPYQGIDIACLLVKLNNGHRLDKPAQCPLEIYNLMLKCWQDAKSMRPTFKELVKELKQTIKDLYQTDV